ncbi:MAG: PEP-CTERM sorting domain-containing protein [Candidatus Zixiibacteriota bacterium]|mgnify:CR=1 FL=1
MKRIFSLLIVLALSAAQAHGFAFGFHNFGSAFDHNNNWSPIHGMPTPFPGNGEYYDLEGLNLHIDQQYVTIAVTNSFGYSAWNPYGTAFRLGDIFFDVDGAKNKFALNTTASGSSGFFKVSSWNYIQNTRGSWYNNARVRNAVGAHEIRTGSKLANVQSSTRYWAGLEENPLVGGNANTWVMEYRFDRSLLGNFKDLRIHTAVGCGNDYMSTDYTAVPEPTTVVLFGLGLVSAGLVRRRYLRTGKSN